MKLIAVAAGCAALLAGAHAFGFGPTGHELVGAVADERLSGTDADRKVRELLGGLDLARAATLADEIKSWDKRKPGDPHPIGGFRNQKLIEALWEFWKANPQPEQANEDTPSHHWFHYTDVPVEENHYDDGTRGRSKWDVVHMIPFCVRVLQGQEPENNPRKITKPVALVLLAHYVGDIHQPLHVGSEYFSRAGAPVSGDADPASLEDEGGNTLVLKLDSAAPGEQLPKLHGFWDNLAVTEALKQISAEITREIESNHDKSFPPFTHAQVVHWLAARQPAQWTADAVGDAEAWTKHRVDETLPLAREAHARLNFTHVKPGLSHGKPVANGEAVPKADAADGKSYVDWSGGIIATQMQRAGWRLAELLQETLK